MMSTGIVGAFADLDRFVDRAEDAFAFIADVRRVDAAVLLGDLRQLDEIGGRREARRRLQQRGREAHRALFHRLRDELLHLVELLRRRRRLAVALHVRPHLLLADVRRDVRRHVLAFELREVAAERRPVDRRRRRLAARASFGPCLDRTRRPRLAQHHRRHALPDHALGLGLDEDRVVRVVVHVDEAGRDGQARRVDAPRRRRVRRGSPMVAMLPVADADVLR